MKRAFIKSLRLLAAATLLLTLVPVLNAQATLASAHPPAYPLAARAAGLEGSVVLKCVITKEGKVRDLKVVSGPVELQQAAMDAVSNWTYHPYKHFGHLVEVDTTVTVNFKLGTGEQKLAAEAKAQAELAKSAESTPSQKPIAATPPKQ